MTELATRQKPIQILQSMEREGKLTPTALIITDELDMDTYESLARYLGALTDSVNWWLGDLFIYGDKLYGELAAQLIEATGRSPGSLQQCVRVSMAIAPGRRHRELSWSHHRAVSHLDSHDQDHWLTEASVNRWNKAELEGKMRPPPDPIPHVQCPTCGGRGWIDDDAA